MKYKCPCCGYYTFSERPNGTDEICPVCFWEDDTVQYENPNYMGGANKVCLFQGQKNYNQFGACEKEIVPYVRKPNEDEMSGID